MNNPFANYLANLTKAAAVLNLNEREVEAMRTPDKIIEKKINIFLDSNSRGQRRQH